MALRRGLAALAVAALAGAALSGCGAGGTSRAEGAPPQSAIPEAQASSLPDFGAAKFEKSTHIDNPWMPLRPGMRFTYEGMTVEDDAELVPHRFVVTVTDLTKTIGGTPCAVTWDLDYSDGELVEAELAFYAQDAAGNVWLIGEYPEEYDNKKMVANPSWLHGIEEARAGIMMQAKPAANTPSYAEGWGPKVHWTDRGQVDSMGVRTCVPVDCYDDVLVVVESSQSEADAQQLKYYARGVGNVRVGWRGAGDKTKETLELTKLEQLNSKELTQARASALELEKRAYRNSKNVYAKTTPATPR